MTVEDSVIAIIAEEAVVSRSAIDRVVAGNTGL